MMESGNSSSMHSSSGGGGGEEYDSRAADQSISAFFDYHNHHVASLPPPQQNHHNPLHFDHNNSLIPQNYFNNNNNGFLPISQQSDLVTEPELRTFSTTSSVPPNNVGVIKKTKKRSRASRRAPTTILTTDTSNFRAMVQEFTGIPSPLFNNNSIMNTTRLNTFLGLSSSSPNSYNSNNNILLRPFAQKLLPTSPLQSGFQQYQSPNNSFENMNLQSLLQAQISNPRSNDHDQFGLGMLQSRPITSLTTTTVANGNITTGENGGYGDSDHDHNNDSTRLCSSSDQKT